MTLPPSAWGTGSIPGQGAKIPHALWTKNQDVKQEQCCNQLNKVLKKMIHIKKKNLKRKKDAILKTFLGKTFHLMLSKSDCFLSGEE